MAATDKERYNREMAVYNASLKVDGDTKMGLITDIKQELRKVNALKINYTTRIGDDSKNIE